MDGFRVYQELSVVLWRNLRRLDRQDTAILSVMDTFEPLLTLKLSIQRAPQMLDFWAFSRAKQ
jgi:hypothetical protein